LETNKSRIQLVSSFHELATTRFADGINAFCWPRTLPGDFAEVVTQLSATVGEGITTLADSQLENLPVSPAGRVAIDVLLADQRLLRERDLDPVLDYIDGCRRDETTGPVRTDVMSFHVDSAPVEADTWLCTYYGPSSEGLRNEEAIRRIDIPETRAELRRLFDDEDGVAFREYLADHCYDLHYAPVPHAQPFSFGLGNLWRLAIEYPGCPVPPCIHRAPETRPGEKRLLLIS